MQMGFYFDQTRCTGCFTCIVACKDWNDVEAGPASWRRVTTIEKGKYPALFVTFLSATCNHCLEPACVSACPVSAISKREMDGVVVVARDVCLGKDNCDMCLQVCPYDAPQFGAEENARMQKCNFCLDRLAEGKKPICVDACPMRAMDAGPIEELRAKYSNIREAEGFVYSETLIPSVIFKPKKGAEGLALQKIEIAPGSLTRMLRV
ncbi:MAG: 4Fe-4S dicluster domain-containing protein [Chloroflexota bacterium]